MRSEQVPSSSTFSRLALILSHNCGLLSLALQSKRVPILFTFLLFSLIFLIGIPKFHLDSSIESWLPNNDPAVTSLNKFKAQFGSDDGLFLVYRTKDRNIFSPRSLNTIRNFTADLENWEKLEPELLKISSEELQGLAKITSVQSIANERYEINSGDTLLSRPILPLGIIINRATAQAIEKITRAQEHLRLLLFSDSGEYGAVLLTTNFGSIAADVSFSSFHSDLTANDTLDVALENFALEVDKEVAGQSIKFKKTHPKEYNNLMLPLKALMVSDQYLAELEFYPIGTAAMVDYSNDIMTQASLLFLLALSIILMLLYSLFGSGSAVLWTILCVVSSAVWLLGCMSWLEVASTQLIILSIFLMLGVGVADCVHVINSYSLFRGEGEGHLKALQNAYEKVAVPIFLTTFTTMAAMLMIAISGTDHFITFGVTSAIGVFLNFSFTIIILPILLDIWHPISSKNHGKKKISSGYLRSLLLSLKLNLSLLFERSLVSWLLGAKWLPKLLLQIPNFSFRGRYFISAVFFGLIILCGFGITRLKIDTNLTELFKEDTRLRQAYSVVDKHMAGTGSMEIVIDLKQSESFADLKVLQSLLSLQKVLEEKYSEYILRTHSLADIVVSLNNTLNDGLIGADELPPNSNSVVQMLSLINNSNPEKRRRIVSDDLAVSHITIQLKNASSSEYASLFKGIENELSLILDELSGTYPEIEYGVTGTVALMMRMGDVLSNAQFKSLVLVIIVISGILLVSLGSLTGGILAVVPNLLPPVVSFGLMGLLGVPLDTDTLMIAPLIIGIAVDDTIHFVTHYRMGLARGLTINQSLATTLNHVGRAVTFTTLILGVSFLILGLSDYLGIARAGLFGSLAIFIALLCDLLFLPALIHIFKPNFGINVPLDH